jgi:sugar phosphate isomerase/epimerase
VIVSFNKTVVAGGALDWYQMIQVAGEVAYDAIDLPRASDLLQEPASATLDRLGEMNLQAGPGIMPVNFREDEATFAETFAGLEPFASYASALGTNVLLAILPASSETPKEDLRPLVIRRLRECALLLADHGLQLALEFYGPLHMREQRTNQFVFTLPDTLAVANEVGPNVGLLLDSWHWHHSGATVDDILEAGDSVLCVQVADAPDLAPALIEDMERLPLGEGIVDLAGFFGALSTIGYGGCVSPEVFGARMRSFSPKDGARMELQKIRVALQGARIALPS